MGSLVVAFGLGVATLVAAVLGHAAQRFYRRPGTDKIDWHGEILD